METTENTLKVLKTMKKAFNETAKLDEAVVNGDLTEEEMLNEPSYLLYNQLLDSAIDIFEREDIQTLIIEIGKELNNPNVSQYIAQLLALVSCISTNNAIHFYDDIITKIIKDRFKEVVDGLNRNFADITSHQATLEVLSKKMGDIENKLQIDEIKKEVDSH